jgi:hypothetical protein
MQKINAMKRIIDEKIDISERMYGPLSEVIAYLQDVLLEYPDAVLMKESANEDTIMLVSPREETDSEYQERMEFYEREFERARKKGEEDARAEREREEYFEMKRKFGY